MIIPNPNITFYPFAEGGVLHFTGSHRLWVLNVTAATLWCLMDGQADTPTLARNYGRRFGIDDLTARQDVDALLSRFAEWGLLDGSAPREEKGPRGPLALEQLAVKPRLEAGDRSGLPRMVFWLAGRCFAVAMEDDLACIWQDLFRHLAASAELRRPDTDWVLVRREDGRDALYFCMGNDGRIEAGLARDEVIPFLVYKLFEQGMAALSHRLLFHAAVVARNGRALLLPAQSGAGKSTLAAALAAQGWTVLSDELAVIDPQTLSVEPFALPIGLKDKSMAALKTFIPDVEDLPRHTRMDGVGVRYLPLPRPSALAPLPAVALVFPGHGHGAPAALETLAPLEALRRLAATGSSARPLAAADVQAMLKLASLPAHALTFADLNAAVGKIDQDVLRNLDGKPTL